MGDRKPAYDPARDDGPKGLPVPDDDLTPVLASPPPSSAAASALAGAPLKRAIEEWAEAKGMLPQVLRGAPPGASAINPEYWKFTATKAFKGWQDGQLVTEEEFDAAVTEQLQPSIR